MDRAERLLVVITPLLAMTAVALGLHIGAGSALRAAVVYGAPASGAGVGLAWQLVTFEEDHGVREPISLPEVSVTALGGGVVAQWKGATNEDGTAEILLPLPSADGVSLEVRARGALLARGDAKQPEELAPPSPAFAWTRFARREGAILMDVAVLGQRVASGFSSSIWVRATDEATHLALSGVTISPAQDGTLSLANATTQTDARGWGEIFATPMGHSVALLLDARGEGGKTGSWAGALFVSPGAAELIARPRYRPDEMPALDIVAPNVRTTAYVEIDDAKGRAWAAVVPLLGVDGGMPRATVRVPALAPGLYWAVSSGDPLGAAQLGPGTSARPFFVAGTDDEALAFGTDKNECTASPLRDKAHALGVCLALAGATAVPRWTAVDGFSAQKARDASRRTGGLTLALGAIAIAMLLETILLLRAAQRARARLEGATNEEQHALGAEAGRTGKVVLALLVALLGFALLAAFLVRAG